MDAEKKEQLIAEVITTLIVIAFYWLSTTPEWKLEMYLRMVTERFRLGRRDAPGLSPQHRETLRQFRQEISEWEHRNASEGN
jgi:hypothetical protein